MNRVIESARDRARQVFAHHVGESATGFEGYIAKGWRQWLICSVSCNLGYFVVRKDDPLGKPELYNCSLADCKANLLAGTKGL